MNDVARILVIAGGVLVLAGVVVWAASAIGLGRLPGDIVIDRPHVRIAFPIVTSIVVSIVLTVVLNIALRLWR
jgi:DUF2905 family protein